MIKKLKEWWYGPQKLKKAGVRINQHGVLYKSSADIVNSVSGRRILNTFCKSDNGKSKD